MSTAGKCICSRKSVRTLCYGWHLVLLSRCFKPKSQWHSTIHTNAQLRIGCVRTHTHTSDYRPLREPRDPVRASTTPTVALQLPTANQNRSSRSSSSQPEAAAAVEHGPKELCIKTVTNPCPASVRKSRPVRAIERDTVRHIHADVACCMHMKPHIISNIIQLSSKHCK